MNDEEISSRGFVFTLDAAFGIFLMVAVLLTISFLSAQADTDSLSQLQLSRVGKDMLFLLDKGGDLQTFNATIVDSTLNSTLPRNLRMHIRVETYYFDDGRFSFYNFSDYGDAVPANRTIFGARRDFVAMNGRQVSNYSIARASIWQYE